MGAQRSFAARGATIGAAIAGVLGAVAGLVIGLRVYAPTAWFAVVELGLPAAVGGGLLGAAIGSVMTLRRRGGSSRPEPVAGAPAGPGPA